MKKITACIAFLLVPAAAQADDHKKIHFGCSNAGEGIELELNIGDQPVSDTDNRQLSWITTKGARVEERAGSPLGCFVHHGTPLSIPFVYCSAGKGPSFEMWVYTAWAKTWLSGKNEIKQTGPEHHVDIRNGDGDGSRSTFSFGSGGSSCWVK